MPKTSVLGRPNYKANLSKEWFNVSEPFKFTSGTGQLLPVYFDFLSPGDKIKYQCSLFSRTEELASPAVVDIDEYVDLFFVPLKKLFSPANQLLEAVDDFESVLFQSIKDEVGQSIMPTLDLEGFFSDDHEYFYPYAPSGHSSGSYGNNMDYFYHGACRLFDHFSLPISQIAYWGISGFDTGVTTQNFSPAISLMYLASYQAIYYDYYRLSNWESNFIFAYNFDDLLPSQSIGSHARTASFDTSKYYKLFELHYRAYDRDYFKAVEPTPLLQSTGVLTSFYGSANVLPQGLGTSFGSNIRKIDESGRGTSSNNLASLDLGTSNPGGFNTLLSLRTSLAWEKMLRIQAMNGQHYDDQVLAHYGFKVPKGIGNEVYYLGSHHQQIHIGEVISTAATSDAPLGQLAGKGYGGSLRDLSKPIEFVAPCHGVVMAIYSCVPELSYQAGLNKLHTAITRYNLPIPEFDSLGMQPMYQYEFDATDRGALAATSRAGWQWRYMEYKVKYPRNTLAFQKKKGTGADFTNGPRSSWSISVRANETGGFTGLDSLLCPPNALDQIMLQSYYYADRDSIIENFLNSPTVLYGGDPLTHFFKSVCYKNSFMSTFGLENLGKV